MIKSTAIGSLKKISLFLFTLFAVISLYLNLPFVFLNNNTCIYIDNKEDFNTFSANIAEKTRFILPATLKIYAELTHLDRHLAAGEYCYTYHDSMLSMMRKIKHGERIRHKFTIVDGWTYQEMIRHLASAPSLSEISLLTNNKIISNTLTLSENSLEGQFYPETYYYAYPDTAIDILQRAHDFMEKRIQMLYQESETQNFFKNPYELLIAASIIQKEASDSEEQKLVAGVIINRFKQHMKLQMDPTVIYGLGRSDMTLLKKHDLKSDTPYNTYLYYGLPPTPICMPGETALYAAAHPKDSNYLYYVSKKNRFHQFSETLAEQNLAIKTYLLAPVKKIA
jgi:UPF0755 protein